MSFWHSQQPILFRYPLVLFQLVYWLTSFIFTAVSNMDSPQFTVQRAALYTLSGFLPTLFVAVLYEATSKFRPIMRLGIFCLLVYIAAIACNVWLRVFLDGLSIETLQEQGFEQLIRGGL